MSKWSETIKKPIISNQCTYYKHQHPVVTKALFSFQYQCSVYRIIRGNTEKLFKSKLDFLLNFKRHLGNSLRLE